MKLLFITRRVDSNDSRAGFSYEWVRTFARHVDQLFVICLERGNTQGLPSMCHVASLGKEHGRNRLREFFLFQWYAMKFVPQVDGIFTHQNPEYGILIAPWAWLFRKKCIAWYTHKAVTWKLRVLEKCIDSILTASRESFRLKSSKVKVLHHGIDAEYFRPVSRKPSAVKTLLSISRLSLSKHIDRMLYVLSELNRRNLGNVTLIVAGGVAVAHDEQYVKKLQQLVQELHINHCVQFLGPVPHRETLPLYQNADLFLNFSDTGSIDKAVLEAMSCGCLVLTSNVAFQHILPSECFTTSIGQQEVAIKVLSLLHMSARDQEALTQHLRRIVVDHHNLEKLATAIVDEFQAI